MTNERDDAISRGSNIYVDPKGCKFGHIPARRYVSSRACINCRESYKFQKPIGVIVPPDQRDSFMTLIRSMGFKIVGEPDETPINPQRNTFKPPPWVTKIHDDGTWEDNNGLTYEPFDTK